MSDCYEITTSDRGLVQVPRVTHVIRRVLAMPELQAWKERRIATVACRRRSSTPSQVLAAVRGDRKAANRGTRVHHWISETLQGRTATVLLDEDIAGSVLAWEKWQHEHAGWTPTAVEQTVTTPFLRAAGTCDAMLTNGAIDLLVDWKTCSEVPPQPWFDHVVQIGAYTSMNNVVIDGQVARIRTPPNRAEIVYLPPSGPAVSYSVNIATAQHAWRLVLDLHREIAAHHQTQQTRKGADSMSPLKSAGAPPASAGADFPDLKDYVGKVVILEPLRERVIETKYNPETEVTDCVAWWWDPKAKEAKEIGTVNVFWSAVRAQLHEAVSTRDQVVGRLMQNGRRWELEEVDEKTLAEIAEKFF